MHTGFRAGWARQIIDITPQGYAMFGYGQWHHRAHAAQTPLFARALCIQTPANQWLIICCLDLGCITQAMRSQAIAQLSSRFAAQFGQPFDETAFVLTATHTHSGPGGCAYEALYNMPTPGFVPEHLAAVSSAIVSAVLAAAGDCQPTDIHLAQGRFADDIPVAWNRSLSSYNLNQDVTPLSLLQTHLALDRNMHLLGFYRQGKLSALLSLFGVHATCLGNQLPRYDGDNKGYAAQQAEEFLQQQGIAQPVAIFAQATAGDVSPHFHGKHQLKRRKQINGSSEYEYAQQNARYQSDMALSSLPAHLDQQPHQLQPVAAQIDHILMYVDFSRVHVKPEFANGETQAHTSQPCHGAAFFAGTPVDGAGTPLPIFKVMQLAAQTVRKLRLSPLTKSSPKAAYYRSLYASQGPKAIVLETGDKKILGQALDAVPGFLDPLLGEMNRQVRAGAIDQSPLVPTVLPLQIIVLGQVALLCCPGEFTTMAGKRLVNTVRPVLQQRGIDQVLLCAYCNDYMGYVTTFEEYQNQAYEGGHTLFGQWTLGAFQTCFVQLAEQLLKPAAERTHDQTTRPAVVPAHELALRTNHGNLKTAVRSPELEAHH